MNWKDRLDNYERLIISSIENTRTKAVTDWMDGKITMDKAREIVAKCNHEIQRIAEGGAA